MDDKLDTEAFVASIVEASLTKEVYFRIEGVWIQVATEEALLLLGHMGRMGRLTPARVSLANQLWVDLQK